MNIYFAEALASVILFGFAVITWLFHRGRGVTRNWIRAEIISLLRNDDTPVAVYAHQARETAEKAREKAQEVQDEVHAGFGDVRDGLTDVRADIREMRGIVIKHVTDLGAHS